MSHHTTYHPLQIKWAAACKVHLVRLLLLGYMLMMAKPILPVLADHLAHKYWKSSHFALVHKHNGNTHVHKEIGKIAQDGQKEKCPTKIKCEVNDIYCLVQSTSILTAFTRYSKPAYGRTLICKTVARQHLFYQPPRC